MKPSCQTLLGLLFSPPHLFPEAQGLVDAAEPESGAPGPRGPGRSGAPGRRCCHLMALTGQISKLIPSCDPAEGLPAAPSTAQPQPLLGSRVRGEEEAGADVFSGPPSSCPSPQIISKAAPSLNSMKILLSPREVKQMALPGVGPCWKFFILSCSPPSSTADVKEP